MAALAVRALMRSPVLAISPHTRLPHIKRLLNEQQIRRVPVLDHERLVGIVTLGDVRNAYPSDATTLSVYELEYLLDQVTAAEIMRAEVVTIGVDAPVLEAAQVMLDRKISGLPVVDRGRVVGMITESDIFRALVSGHMPLPITGVRPQQTADPTTTGWPIV